MAPTMVNAAFAALLAAALLGAAFDRRSVAIVIAAGVIPDLDAVVSLVIPGATNALFHNAFVLVGLVVLVHWDTVLREESWLRDRYGWWGVRVAWVAVAAYGVAGIGPELFSAQGVNLLYPVHDVFIGIVGLLVITTQEGIVQTYIGFGGSGLVEVYSPGTTAEHHVPSFVNPTGASGIDGGVERRAYLVTAGWQVVVIGAAVATLAVRFWEEA